jgi:tetratricopeptide (TPR) repeat protein
MNKYLKQIFLLVIILISNASISQIVFRTGTYQEMCDLAVKENKVLMIDFYTDWCKWCVELERKTYTNKEVADYANSNLICWKIDCEKGEGPEISKKYNIQGYPTIIFITPEGDELDRILDYYPPEIYYKKMTDYSKGINTTDYLQKKLEVSPYDAEVNFIMGKKLIDEDKRPDARKYFYRCINADKDNQLGLRDDAMLWLAYANGSVSDFKLFFSMCFDESKIKTANLYLAKVYYMDYKDYEKAQDIFELLISKYKDEDIIYAYGLFLLDKFSGAINDKSADNGKLLLAVETGNKCLQYMEGSVHSASVNYLFAVLYKKTGDKVKANEYIDKAISIFDRKLFRDFKAKLNS